MPHDEVRAAQLTQAQEHDNAQLLRGAIEREYPNIRRGLEVYVWRWQLAYRREDIVNLAEEVFQEVVVRALSRPGAYDPSRSVHGWLLGIGLNVLREYIRRTQRDHENLAQSMDSVKEYQAAKGVTSNQLTHTFDVVLKQHDSLFELLELVPPQDRLILQYRYVDGLTGHELAEALGVREVTARVQLSRAVRRLSAAYHEAEQAGKGDRE
jgi:RNA polymerase sigma-70 factor (ECF subfamily)